MNPCSPFAECQEARAAGPCVQIARKLLGGRWELRSGLRMPAPSAELAAAGKLLTMQDYKRRQGLA